MFDFPLGGSNGDLGRATSFFRPNSPSENGRLGIPRSLDSVLGCCLKKKVAEFYGVHGRY